MAENFYDMQVWQDALDFVIEVYLLTEKFPSHERFGLVTQTQRSANSVPANIAEGFGRYYRKDKIKFYYQARGSLTETLSHMFVAERLKYVSSLEKDNILQSVENIGKQINGLIRALEAHIV